MPVPHYVERDVHPLCRRDSRIYLVLQPVISDFLLNYMHIPGVFRTEVAPTPGDAESALRAAGAKAAVGPANRATFSESDLVVLRFGRGLGLFLRFGDLLFLRLDLRVLAGDLDRIRRFLFNLGLWAARGSSASAARTCW